VVADVLSSICIEGDMEATQSEATGLIQAHLAMTDQVRLVALGGLALMVVGMWSGACKDARVHAHRDQPPRANL
jgi:hypothetical protein